MPIVRHAPGDSAPVAGTYALVGHYGEVVRFAQWFNEGDRFPLALASPELGHLWYVLVDEAQPHISTATA